MRAPAILVATLWIGALCPPGPIAGETLRLDPVVLTRDADDPRIALVGQAIETWNRAFLELGLEPRIPDPKVVLDPPAPRSLETFAHRIATLAGRMNTDQLGPRPPQELVEMKGNLLILLSVQKVMPFAWPLDDHRRFFLALPTIDPSGPDLEQVIAHEIGHVLGLEHGDDPMSLMCEPCQRLSESPQPGRLPRPLSAAARSRLLELYGERINAR